MRPLDRGTQRRGITLLLTLLLLAVMSLVLARRVSQAATERVASAATVFSVESRWAAEGAARQWLTRAQDPSVPWSDLFVSRQWQLGALQLQVRTSSAEDKLCLKTVKTDRWLALWRKQNNSLLLVDNPEQALAESNFTALECLLDRRYPSVRPTYIAQQDEVAPADLLTIWGDGKVNLNRAPAEVLTAALDGFTDAQIGSIIQLRRRRPIESLSPLSDELALSTAQQQKLKNAATLQPRFLEMLIDVRRGPMRVLYHAVLDTQAPGKVLELRVIP